MTFVDQEHPPEELDYDVKHNYHPEDRDDDSPTDNTIDTTNYYYYSSYEEDEYQAKSKEIEREREIEREKKNLLELDQDFLDNNNGDIMVCENNCSQTYTCDDDTYVSRDPLAHIKRDCIMVNNAYGYPDYNRLMTELEDSINYYFYRFAKKNNTQANYIYNYEYDGNYNDYIDAILDEETHESAFDLVKRNYKSIQKREQNQEKQQQQNQEKQQQQNQKQQQPQNQKKQQQQSQETNNQVTNDEVPIAVQLTRQQKKNKKKMDKRLKKEYDIINSLVN
jgi:hypothetical protein